MPLIKLPAVQSNLPPRWRAGVDGDKPGSDQLATGDDRVGEVNRALAIVFEHCRVVLHIALPQRPPDVHAVAASGTMQRQLLQLLQAVLGGRAVGRPPPSHALVGHAEVLMRFVHAELGRAAAEAKAARAAAKPPAQLVNAALKTAAAAADVMEDASLAFVDALNSAHFELHRRAWAGATRPEACHVRCFVRLRAPTTFEAIWARRCERLSWAGARRRPSQRAARARRRAAAPGGRRRPRAVGVSGGGGTQRRSTRWFAALRGVNGTLICVGGAGTGKTTRLHGSDSARHEPLEAPRQEWGAALRAASSCWSTCRSRRAPSRRGGGLTSPRQRRHHDARPRRGAPRRAAIPAPPPPPSHVLHASAIEVEGERVVDLLGGGTPLSVSADGLGPPKVNGAVQARIETLDDAAYTLKAAMRTRQHGVLAPRASTIVTLTLRRAGGGESTLTFVDLAGGDPMLGGSAAAVARAKGKGGAARSLAALGAAVAARAEARRGAPGASRGMNRRCRAAARVALRRLVHRGARRVRHVGGRSGGTLGTLLFLRRRSSCARGCGRRPTSWRRCRRGSRSSKGSGSAATATARRRRRRRAPRRRRARRG